MTNSDRQGYMLTALAGCDIDALVFTAEMYGVQLDQLAAVLGVSVAYQRARPFWRGERRIRAAVRASLRDHLPDGELHWPAGAALSWAGECWAVQAELTHQAVTRTSE